jgi:cystathionine beta-lyase
MSSLRTADLASLQTRTSLKWRMFEPDVLPLFVAESDYALAPCITDALQEALERGDVGYAPPETPELAQAFADHARRNFAWKVDPSSVRAFPDVMVGVVELLRVLGPGRGVVINTPAYPPFFEAIPEAGCRLVEVPLTERDGFWELDLAGLERAFKAGARFYLLCNPHNPTGRVFAKEELQQIAHLARTYGVTVLSDEIHGPLVLPGARHVPYLAEDVGAGDDAVVLTSASKAWNIPGLKCALAVAGNERVQEAFDRLPDQVRYRTGILGVLANTAAFSEGKAWLDESLEHIDGNRRLLSGLLEQAAPAVGYRPPEATYLAWLDFRAIGIGDDPAAFLRREGAVALGRGLDFGAPGAGFARLTFATSSEVLTEAVARIATALRVVERTL